MKIVAKVLFIIALSVSIYLGFGEYLYTQEYSKSMYQAFFTNHIDNFKHFLDFSFSTLYLCFIFYPALIFFLSFFIKHPFLVWQRILFFLLAGGVFFTMWILVLGTGFVGVFSNEQYSELHFSLTLTMLWGVIWFLVLCFSGSYYSELFHWMFKKRDEKKKE